MVNYGFGALAWGLGDLDGCGLRLSGGFLGGLGSCVFWGVCLVFGWFGYLCVTCGLVGLVLDALFSLF